MDKRRQAEKTAEAFASSFFDDVFGIDFFLGAHIERLLADSVNLIYQNIEDVDFHGAAVHHELGDQFVILNTFHPLRMRYFTAAHELWHLSEGSKLQGASFDHERAADHFAACIMLPRALVLNLWRKLREKYDEEKTILSIADLSAIPYKAVERRFKELGENIVADYTEEEWLKLRDVYYMPKTPLDISIPDTRFVAYEKIVIDYVEKGLNPLTASNKLALFAPQQALIYQSESSLDADA